MSAHAPEKKSRVAACQVLLMLGLVAIGAKEYAGTAGGASCPRLLHASRLSARQC
jgi:hypothetical protein